MSAWIETNYLHQIPPARNGRTLMSAWIETSPIAPACVRF